MRAPATSPSTLGGGVRDTRAAEHPAWRVIVKGVATLMVAAACTGTPSPPPPTPSRHAGPSERRISRGETLTLVRQFMDRRLSGSNAEQFLDEPAAAYYAEPPFRGLSLYGSPRRTIVGYSIRSAVRENDTDSTWLVEVCIEVISDTREIVCEQLEVGPRTGSGDVLVLAAERCRGPS